MSDTLFTITSGISIGDELSAVNSNHLLLDTLVHNIQLSAVNFWIPLAKYYETNKAAYESAANSLQANHASWNSAVTTFEANSSRWITPIVTWYPVPISVLDGPTETQRKLLAWVEQNYPVFNTNSPVPNFLEGQNLIVHCFNYREDIPIKQTNFNIDTTLCSTYDQNVCAYCYRCYSGTADCGNYVINCNGNCASSNTCKPLTCRFPNGSTAIQSTIANTVITDYANKYETTDLTAQVFIMAGCRWVFDKFLTSR